MSQYLTIAETLKSNGDRHRRLGDAYLSEGNLQYAVGSYKKMLRNYEASLSTTTLIDCGLDKTVLDMDRLAEEIAKSILGE